MSINICEICGRTRNNQLDFGVIEILLLCLFVILEMVLIYYYLLSVSITMSMVFSNEHDLNTVLQNRTVQFLWKYELSECFTLYHDIIYMLHYFSTILVV